MKIAVLSKSSKVYSTARLLEEATNRGHEIIRINHGHSYIKIGKRKHSIHFNEQIVTGVDAIIPRIGASITAYGSAIVRQFEMKGVYTTASSISIVRTADKLRSLQLLARSGINVPKTVFARNTRDVNGLIEMVGGTPVIIKILDGALGKGVVLAETKKAAKSVIEAFYGQGVDILIQEFIEESNGTDIRAFVIDGKVVASMKRIGAEDDFRSNIHAGGSSEVVELTPKEQKIAIQSAQKLGLQIAGVDILRSNRGPLVIEVNSTPGLEGIETSTGINIAGKIIEHIENNHNSKRSKDKIGA